MKSNAMKKRERFASIWDIPKLDLSELNLLVTEVPFDTLRLAILNVSDEIRGYVYNAVDAQVAEQLRAFYQLKQMMLQKEVIKESDITEAQDEVGQVMERLFEK